VVVRCSARVNWLVLKTRNRLVLLQTFAPVRMLGVVVLALLSRRVVVAMNLSQLTRVLFCLLLVTEDFEFLSGRRV